jgi:hypothetical protein
LRQYNHLIQLLSSLLSGESLKTGCIYPLFDKYYG